MSWKPPLMPSPEPISQPVPKLRPNQKPMSNLPLEEWMELILYLSPLKPWIWINILELSLKHPLMDPNPLWSWKTQTLPMLDILIIKLSLKLSMPLSDINQVVIFKTSLIMKCVWEFKVAIFVSPIFIADGAKLPTDAYLETKNIQSVLLIVLMDGSMKDNLVKEVFLVPLKMSPLKLPVLSPPKWPFPKLTSVPLLIIPLLSIPLLSWESKPKRKKLLDPTLSPENPSPTILGMWPPLSLG